MLDYSLKFTNLVEYVPSLVSDPRDEMNLFVTGVFAYLKKNVVCLLFIVK